MKQAEILLEFDKIKEKLTEYTHSSRVTEKIRALAPTPDEAECLRRNAETTAGRTVLDACGNPPLPYTGEIAAILELCRTGVMLIPDQLSAVSCFAASCRRVAAYLKRAESAEQYLASWGNSIQDLRELQEEIDRCIRGDRVESTASGTLHDLRRKTEQTEAQIRSKIDSILRGNKKWFSEDFISLKNGRYVLPVKRQFRHQFQGSVIEISASGGTCYMEPDSVTRLQAALESLQIDEDNEVRRILYTLTVLTEDFGQAIETNLDVLERLDFIFAKARLSQGMEAIPAEITTERSLRIRQGRHPLLEGDVCVPLDFEPEEGIHGVIITGPNTGGKTVALKTVGLLSMMAQSGLHIPARAGTRIAMCGNFLCDIGDGQSISENLSTFSGHMKNIIEILSDVGSDSMVLLDELGSGTDPAEGMGIAVAVLEELRQSGCLFLVTTHYPQVKEYARNTEGILSARMAFDRETLSPLYRLELGQSGESCALHIAARLGLPSHILHRAEKEAYGTSPKIEEGEASRRRRPARIRRKAEPKPLPETMSCFVQGDNVMLPDGSTGIVYQPANERGEVCVQVKGKKQYVNHRRIRMHIPASQLYPQGYDLSIVFDTVENRKARRKLDKGNPNCGAIVYDD